jgi:transglutaminase-like putative cysteine protease
MNYEIRHQTRVRYKVPVSLARLNLRLRPARWPDQELSQHSLKVMPRPATIVGEDGPWIVHCDRITIREPITELVIESRCHVSVHAASSPPDQAPAPGIEEVRRTALSSRDMSTAGPAAYLYASQMAETAPEIARWAGEVLAGATTALAAGDALTEAIHAGFRYDGTATVASTPPIDAFRQRRGVCQDFSHVMIIAARAHGIPAAYVSGYLRTLPPPGKPRLVGADAMHAWVALWCGEDRGWVGFDPTNAMRANTDHIFVAMGRDYADVAPIDGVLLGGQGQKMDLSVDVIPLD